MTDPSGTTTYNYDNRNRLLSKATPFGTLSYTYDAANLLTITSSNLNGAAMTYSYDTLNRLSTVKDASGTTTYNYDPVGNLASFIYPNGVQHSYTYDPQNRLTQMGATCGTAVPGCAAGTQLSSYTYTLGAAGNRLSVAELSGRNVSYGYDDLYRLTSESITCAVATPNCTTQNGSIGYAYDNVGNRQSMTSTVPAIPPGQFSFDADDRLTTDNYDPNGNTISSGGILNAYDFENHLIKHGNVTVVYDGDGNRVSETVGGVTTNYLVDTNNPTSYAQVVDELQNNSVTRTYSYGLERIYERQLVAGNWQLSFYGYDGHGSVRQLLSSTGAVTDIYDYDAFGNLISSTGTTPNNYLFAGEQFNPALGMYFLRARYYNASTGRFWSTDSFEGDPESPLSLHKYLYCGVNPTGCIDPSGYDSYVDTIGSLSVSDIVNAISLPNFINILAGVAVVLLVTAGALSINQVIRASRANADEWKRRREAAKEEAEQNRSDPNSKLLFHYTDRTSAEQIFATGVLLGFPGRGGFPFGGYATDIAGWLAESLMRRSQLTTLIFGRNTEGNYAQTAWFVAFEQNPRYPFKKVAPS